MKSLNITVNMEESFTQATIKLRPAPSSRSVASVASTGTTASFTGVVHNGGAAGGGGTGAAALVGGVPKPSAASLAKVYASTDDDQCDNGYGGGGGGGPGNTELDGDFHVTATIRIKSKSSASGGSSSSNNTSISSHSAVVHNGIENHKPGGTASSSYGNSTSNSSNTSNASSGTSVRNGDDEEECNQQNNNVHASNSNVAGSSSSSASTAATGSSSLSNGNSYTNNNNTKSYNDLPSASRAGHGSGSADNHNVHLKFSDEKPTKDNDDDDGDDDRVSYLQTGVGSKELSSSSGSYRASKDYDLSYRLSSSGAGASVLPKSSYDSNYDVADSVRGRKEGLCGLWNIGNTCFMNSIIQCLSHTRELTAFLRAQSTTERGTSKDHRILVEYTKLIKDMWSGTQRSVNPSELKYAFSSKHRMYSGSAQQDAQEFLRFFLDSLHGALNVAVKRDPLGELDDDMNNRVKADMLWEWYSKAENSMIKDLFVGQLRSTLKCTYCNTESTMFDPFWDLSLPLPTSNSRSKLENCLEMFIKEEIMDGIDQPTCSKCNTRRKCTKSLTIERFPKYLVIHLKRFSETRWSKLTNVIEFPCGERGLNLQPYASEDNVGPAYYTLYGISNHMGSTAGGHYVAVCKHSKTKEWNEFNDNFVSETSERSLITSSAYVLFYERA